MNHEDDLVNIEIDNDSQQRLEHITKLRPKRPNVRRPTIRQPQNKIELINEPEIHTEINEQETKIEKIKTFQQPIIKLLFNLNYFS